MTVTLELDTPNFDPSVARGLEAAIEERRREVRDAQDLVTVAVARVTGQSIGIVGVQRQPEPKSNEQPKTVDRHNQKLPAQMKHQVVHNPETPKQNTPANSAPKQPPHISLRGTPKIVWPEHEPINPKKVSDWRSQHANLNPVRVAEKITKDASEMRSHNPVAEAEQITRTAAESAPATNAEKTLKSESPEASRAAAAAKMVELLAVPGAITKNELMNGAANARPGEHIGQILLGS